VTLYQITLKWNTTASSRPANPSDPNDPAYRWPPEIDDAIEQAHRHHMRVLILISARRPGRTAGSPQPTLRGRATSRALRAPHRDATATFIAG